MTVVIKYRIACGEDAGPVIEAVREVPDFFIDCPILRGDLAKVQPICIRDPVKILLAVSHDKINSFMISNRFQIQIFFIISRILKRNDGYMDAFPVFFTLSGTADSNSDKI